MKGALVWYGTIAAGHHRAYLELKGASIDAVVDVSPMRRDAARTLDPRVETYSSLAELLASESLDFIDICLPPSMHFEHICQALDAGCHVLCEKPFLPDLATFDRLIGRLESCDRFVYPGHNYKFSPVMRRLVQEVRASTFGELLRGFFLTRRSGHARGVPEWHPDWRRDPTFSHGGILQDHATHSIYLASHLCNSAPNAVSCILGNLRRDAFSSTEDTALLVLYFPSGTEIRLDLTWACEHRHTAYTLLGRARSVVVENDNWLSIGDGFVQQEEIVSDFNDPTHQAWFIDMLADFINNVNDRHKQKRLLWEAWTTCAVIEAAYTSARTGGARVAVTDVPTSLAMDPCPSVLNPNAILQMSGRN